MLSIELLQIRATPEDLRHLTCCREVTLAEIGVY